MTTKQSTPRPGLTLAGTLAGSWSLPPSEKFPEPSAGISVLVEGRLITLYGPALAELVGKPDGTPVALLLDALPDREQRNRYRLRPRSVRYFPVPGAPATE